MLLDRIEKVLLATARQRLPISYCIWGKHGIGKTQIIEQVAKKLGYKMRNFRMSQIDSTELVGFPYYEDTDITLPNGEVRKTKVLKYAPPLWYAEAMQGNYIIFLDELNRAKKDNINAAFELVNERSIGGLPLPETVLIVVANNPPHPSYQTIDFDDALVDRFCHIHARSNYEVWLDWANKKDENGSPNINADIINFLNQDKSRQTFDKIDPETDKLLIEINPSPRSWKRADLIDKLIISEDDRLELWAGTINQSNALNYKQSRLQRKKPITLDEIINADLTNPDDSVYQRIVDLSNNEMEKIIENDGSESFKEKVVELSKIKVSCDEICNPENLDLVDQNINNVLLFLSLIPTELAYSALIKLTKSHKRAFTEKLRKQLMVQKEGEIETDFEKAKEDEFKTFKYQKLIKALNSAEDARAKL